MEGEEKTVKALFSKIGQDPRHRKVLTLVQEKIEKRKFPDFTMAFYDLETTEKPPGCSDFLTLLNGDTNSKDASKAKRWLSLFKKNIR